MEVYWMVCQHLLGGRDRGLRVSDPQHTSPGTLKEHEAFPTEQAICQKEAKKEKQKQLENNVFTKDEIKQKTKRKPQPQEQYYDDCGSDTGPIEERASPALLACTHGTIDDAIAFPYLDGASCGSLADDAEEVLREHNFHLHYLLISEVDEDHPSFVQNREM